MNMKSRSQTKVVASAANIASAADRDAKLDIAHRFHAALAAARFVSSSQMMHSRHG